MTKQFDLKLPSIIKKIVDLYSAIDILSQHNTASGYLKPKIYAEVNKILDFFESQMETNDLLKKKLKDEEYKDIFEILKAKKRF